ncbi:MAG: (d)CMP kinase [Sedimentisphaerales bacterium]|nr:(d)CMP kinase [Sedimentisphaerales bacterium]
MSNFIITIDGPAASGKSTVARLLAQKLGASFLDTGAMYRAVTFAAMQSGIDLTSEEKLLEVIADRQFDFTTKNNSMAVRIDGTDVSEQIREQNVTANARYIAAASRIREKLVQMQRQFASEQKSIVTEGRDQGTVAFPDADVKFFMTAQPGERARRRLAELKVKGIKENLEQIQDSIEKRDKNDMERNVGPLKPADDAIVIDTTNLDINEVVDRLLDCVRQKGLFAE